MWQTTKHGLYKQFNFSNFKEAWSFMNNVAVIAEERQKHPRWENEWSVVQIWLLSHDESDIITDIDKSMAEAIDEIARGTAQPKLSTKMKNFENVKVFADGGSRGNPGPSASGFVILDKEDTILSEKGAYIGITTNNQAEYMALKLALIECIKLHVTELKVYMDSLLVVNQMNGIYKIKNRELWPIHDAIKEIAQNFRHITYQHVPREFNKQADAAVNRALDDQLGIKNNRY